ncbi:MAG: asparaginase [Dethiobacter sp.]|nr:asparaginase [Dethiobacter sp.]
MSVKLVEVTRGEVVESIHRGDIAVVRHDGNVLYQLGNVDYLTFMRSSSKPIQAIAVLEYGIVEKYGLDLPEVAMIMSSHSGEKVHIDLLNEIIRKVGIDINTLQCGIHPPVSADAAQELISKGQTPSSLHCNCSGKHLGQIAAVKIKGSPLENYDQIHGGIQPGIQDIISTFSGVEAEQIKLGIDGCGIPVYGMPLKNMALAYANLCNENFMNGRYGKSQNYVLSAMSNHPELMAGKGRLDTELMRHFGDRLVSKSGDEGVCCAGLKGKGLGIALKIEDGHTRAVGPAIIEVLKQLGVIKEEEMALLKDFWNPSIKNHKEEKVGEIRAAFPGSFEHLA